MDEIERRLSEALAAEAKSVVLQPDAWDRQRNRASARRRSTFVPWLAAAAAVAVIALGTTIAVRGADGHRAATGRQAVATSNIDRRTSAALPAKNCDDASKAKTVTIIGASGPPTTAQLFFSGVSLCSRINTDGGSTGGGTGPTAGPVGYYSAIWGEKTYLLGAFTSPTTSLTLIDRATSWSLTISATTAGVTDLGGGWSGYLVRAPFSTSDVQITAKSVSGAALGSAELSFDGGWVGAPNSGGSAVASTSPPVSVTSVSTLSTGTATAADQAGAQPPAICGGVKSGAGMSDVGVHGNTIKFALSADGKTLCFFNGVVWTTAQQRPGAIRFLGTAETVSGASTFGAVVGDIPTMRWTKSAGSESFDVGSFISSDGLTYFVVPAGARSVSATDAHGKTVVSVDLSAAAARSTSPEATR